MKIVQWLIILMMGMVLGLTNVHAREFLVVYEGWAPFEYEENGQSKGIDIDIANVIFTKLGITPKYQDLPWKRAEKVVQDGKADAVLSTSKKPEREVFLIYPEEEFWVSEFIFLTNK